MLTQQWCELACALVGHRWCPSCPTVQAARDVFFTEDLLTRMSGMIGPFVVTAALVGLVVSRLGEQRQRDKVATEASHEAR